MLSDPTTRSSAAGNNTDSITSPVKKPIAKRMSFTFTSSSANNNNSGFLMKLMPHRRRHSELVKRTSFVLDDYANVLSRDSSFLAAGGDASTVMSATSAAPSLNESSHTNGTATTRPSIVIHSSVGSFQRQEVVLGELLGKGQFSKVYAITSIALDDDDDKSAGFDAKSNITRAAMSQNAREGKYAMKRLRKKLLRRPREFTRAAANLVLEAQFLSRLDHPHIIKLRGSALGGSIGFQTGEHDGYFLIIDRFQETLAERIHSTWNAARKEATTTKAFDEPELLYQKACYALQLASALHYLHERRIIFRDCKPTNMGFTDEHTVQLCDFGMARELPQELGLTNELFYMTQNTGSNPYKAPEVSTTGLYNLKADVFSWSMVVYELMAEQVPFAHLVDEQSKKPFMNNREYVEAVYCEGERPTFPAADENPKGPKLPPHEIQNLLSQCWDADTFSRPTMETVYTQMQDMVGRIPHRINLHNKDLQAIPPKPEIPHMVLEAQKRRRQFLEEDPGLSDVSDRSN